MIGLRKSFITVTVGVLLSLYANSTSGGVFVLDWYIATPLVIFLPFFTVMGPSRQYLYKIQLSLVEKSLKRKLPWQRQRSGDPDPESLGNATQAMNGGVEDVTHKLKEVRDRKPESVLGWEPISVGILLERLRLYSALAIF